MKSLDELVRIHKTARRIPLEGGAAWNTEIGIEAVAKAVRDEGVERWYVGSMNDALFIINRPPRPVTDDPWHDRPDGPTMILKTYPLKPEEVQAIVDAHNQDVEPKRLATSI